MSLSFLALWCLKLPMLNSYSKSLFLKDRLQVKTVDKDIDERIAADSLGEFRVRINEKLPSLHFLASLVHRMSNEKTSLREKFHL